MPEILARFLEGAMVVLMLVVVGCGISAGLQALGGVIHETGAGAGLLAQGLGSLVGAIGQAAGSVLGGVGRAGAGLGAGLGAAATGMGRGLGEARGQRCVATPTGAGTRPGFGIPALAGSFLAGAGVGAGASYLWQRFQQLQAQSQQQAPGVYPVNPADASQVAQALTAAGVPHQWYAGPDGIPYVVIDPTAEWAAHQAMGAAGFGFDEAVGGDAQGWQDWGEDWDGDDSVTWVEGDYREVVPEERRLAG
jgi:hypothetical protein